MIARELISSTILPLKTSTTGFDAVEAMRDYNVRHLPIVNNTQLLGVLSEDDILDYNETDPLGSYQLSLTKPYAKENDHIFEVLHLMSNFNLTIIPVIDAANDYVGCIAQEDLIQYFAKSFSFTEPGSIIVLELNERDYSLSEIARIIESENTRVLSTFVTSDPEIGKIYITVKLNRQDIRAIIATFERYEYQVLATYTEKDFEDSIKERYDLLMTYLNV